MRPDMTPAHLAAHWRMQAGQCEQMAAAQHKVTSGQRSPLPGHSMESYAANETRNTITAEVLRSCAEELESRLIQDSDLPLTNDSC